MTAFLLLLRGINVGGNHKVNMTDLKTDFLVLGLQNPLSYINSGNLYFESKTSHTELVDILREYFERNFEFKIPFLLIEQEKLSSEYLTLPQWWFEDKYRKNALFFLPEMKMIEQNQIVSEISIKDGENIFIGDYGIYWTIDTKEQYNTSFYHKDLIKKKWYKFLTIRNANTVNHITKVMGLKKA